MGSTMRRWLVLCCMIGFLVGNLSPLGSTSVMTVSYVGARIGNLLATYVQARWLAHKHKLVFLTPPIPELAPFNVYRDDDAPTVYDLSKYNFVGVKNVVKIRNLRDGIIYVQNFSYLSAARLAEMKQDPEFLKAIRQELSTKEPLKLIYPPGGRISVAVHLRKGGGFDKPLKSVQIFNLKYAEDQVPKVGERFDDKRYPLKLPPEQFYIDQLQALAKRLGDVPVFVYIFTDDRNPQVLQDRIEKEVGLGNFTFACRTGEAGHDKNVLEDLYSMPNFDYLIFPHSTYSNLATLLGDFKGMIYPTGYHWEQDNQAREYLVIDKVAWLESPTADGINRDNYSHGLRRPDP